MESRAKFLGHPIHQMLIVFPLGLLGGAVLFDVLHLITGTPRWAEMSFWLIAAGLISALAAAIFGFIDWRAIPAGTRAKRIGTLHGLGNIVVVVLFALSWFLRREAPVDPSIGALVASFSGFALAGVTAWLGGELVDRLGVGVDDGAHLNASSSLSGLPPSPAR